MCWNFLCLFVCIFPIAITNKSDETDLRLLPNKKNTSVILFAFRFSLRLRLVTLCELHNLKNEEVQMNWNRMVIEIWPLINWMLCYFQFPLVEWEWIKIADFKALIILKCCCSYISLYFHICMYISWLVTANNNWCFYFHALFGIQMLAICLYAPKW